MMIVRWFSLGLLVAILACVISLTRSSRQVSVCRAHHRAHPTVSPLRVVDIVPGVDPAALLLTDFREEIVAVDDLPVTGNAAGLAYLRAHLPARGEYADVTLRSLRGHEKRVLLLMH